MLKSTNDSLSQEPTTIAASFQHVFVLVMMHLWSCIGCWWLWWLARSS